MADDAHGNAVGFAAVAGAVPAVAMLLGSALLLRVDVAPRTQAIFQNLSAGIILAAVASELFPLLGKSGGRTSLGLALGFGAGLCTVFGVEKIASAFEAKQNAEGDSQHTEEALELLNVSHREHIKGHLDELAAAVQLVDQHATQLASADVAPEEEEQLSEAIDEELHRLMYKLDHTRRLLEGAESGAPRALPAADKAALRSRVEGLKAAVAHLQEHMATDAALDNATVLEMHGHMVDLDGLLDTLHRSTAASFSYWRRGAMAAGADTRASRLPWALIAPVTIDACVDGFLIGLSCALSHHAGMVLAFATCIEMAFLGAAYAGTVARCAGVRRSARLAAVALPPVALLVAALVGGALGDVSASSPVAFEAFVAFGVVALLFLVTQELLVEAHEALKGDDVWWINVWLFAGIFLVLQINRLLPEG